MKITRVTSKELLIDLYGHECIQHYEAVKVGAMRMGNELAAMLIREVGGRVGGRNDPYDGLTRHGMWEFTLSKNAKNGAGNSSDLTRAPGRCVQILEEPNPGWMSAEDFLAMHGVGATALLDIIERYRGSHSLHEQTRLPV